ncbi:DUF1471 domain-containing protein [Serratia oryzae]|uniref:YdgH/BhsA/McbA-like domain-containing protein n=1 Tax=Serratia oryzae TaxID=2034155 RepID=A0A1S8CN92_9GAMM|nr:DUF1471 domain-containing protein [Serratia oryzae]OMQ24455.1 hypothetical protein BMI79_06360 [Serratia oryzae]VXC88315.1 conserved exported hypothetical protein [Enterobacterales bacterium 8AC]
MKKITITVAACLFSVSALAAQPTQQPNLHPMGSVTVSAMTTLAEAEKGIAEQAKVKSASHYRIISVSGKNKLHASAVIYR